MSTNTTPTATENIIPVLREVRDLVRKQRENLSRIEGLSNIESKLFEALDKELEQLVRIRNEERGKSTTPDQLHHKQVLDEVVARIETHLVEMSKKDMGVWTKECAEVSALYQTLSPQENKVIAIFNDVNKKMIATPSGVMRERLRLLRDIISRLVDRMMDVKAKTLDVIYAEKLYASVHQDIMASIGSICAEQDKANVEKIKRVHEVIKNYYLFIRNKDDPNRKMNIMTLREHITEIIDQLDDIGVYLDAIIDHKEPSPFKVRPLNRQYRNASPIIRPHW